MTETTLLADIHEPPEFTKYLSGVVPIHVTDLNNRGYADYMWSTHDGSLVQVERKQWGELLSGLDAVENQLRNHLLRQSGCQTYLLVEGMAVSTPGGTTILKGTSKNLIYVGGYESSVRHSQLYAWLYQINRYLPVYFTSGYLETCIALSSFYKGDQKAEHTTFQRAFKRVEYSIDPRITQVMGVFPGIGEKRASALVARFGTLFGIVSSTVAELCTVDGIGKKLATDLLRKAGRLDV